MTNVIQTTALFPGRNLHLAPNASPYTYLHDTDHHDCLSSSWTVHPGEASVGSGAECTVGVVRGCDAGRMGHTVDVGTRGEK